jgi:hypothetical protein
VDGRHDADQSSTTPPLSPDVTSIARTASCRPRAADYLGGSRAQTSRESISLVARCRVLRSGSIPGTDGSRIPIRFGRLKPLFVVLGITPASSYLELDTDRVRVRLSWAFRGGMPRPSIRSVRRVSNSISIGAHGWRGRWLVNGAAGPLVAIAIDPPGRAWVLGVPMRLRELIVSVDDPDAVIAELSPAAPSR